MCARGGGVGGTHRALDINARASACAGAMGRSSRPAVQSHIGPRTELERLVAEVEESCDSFFPWEGLIAESEAQSHGRQQHLAPPTYVQPPRSTAGHGCGGMPVSEDWAVIREVMMLAEQKEAEVFATLLAYREKQMTDLRQNCQQTQAEIRNVVHQNAEVSARAAPEKASKGSAASAHEWTTKGRGPPATFRSSVHAGLHGSMDMISNPLQGREDMHVLHQLDEVSILATPSSPSTARLETASGSPSLDTHTQTTTPYWLTPRPPQVLQDQVEAVVKDDEESSLPADALQSLREKDELLSLGMSWLEGELEDAKFQVDRVKEAARVSAASTGSHSAYSHRQRDAACEISSRDMSMPADLQRAVPCRQPAASVLTHPEGSSTEDLLNAKVAEFLEAPEHGHCRSLLRRVGPGIYLYGSTPVALRIGIATGSLEVSCDTGRSWARLSDFASCIDSAHDDLVQGAWAIVSIRH